MLLLELSSSIPSVAPPDATAAAAVGADEDFLFLARVLVNELLNDDCKRVYPAEALVRRLLRRLEDSPVCSCELGSVLSFFIVAGIL